MACSGFSEGDERYDGNRRRARKMKKEKKRNKGNSLQADILRRYLEGREGNSDNFFGTEKRREVNEIEKESPSSSLRHVATDVLAIAGVLLGH